MIVRPDNAQHHAGANAYPLESGDLLRLGRTEMRVIVSPLETLDAPARVAPNTASRDDASAQPRVDTGRREGTR
jgi:hypothetical protein